MRVALKNVKFSESLSEETNAFTANVYVNNKHVGYARNDGRGGCTNVYAIGETRERDIFKLTEKFLLEQPDINIGSEAKPFMVDCNMENVVDKLFEEWLLKKEEKKIEKLCEKGIVYKTIGGYATLTWKNNTIKTLSNNTYYRKMLFDKVNELKKEGKEIVNKNLPTTPYTKEELEAFKRIDI